MKTIGLIGGIASGKTMVGEILNNLGAAVINGDKEAHSLYASGTSGFDKLVDVFGVEVVGPDGEIDRQALGRIVFNSDSELQKLNNIVWPLARERVIALKQIYEEEQCPILVIEAAMLLEAECQDLVDEIWLVTADESARQERLSIRSGLNKIEGEARINKQKKGSEIKELLVDMDLIIIENNGTIEDLVIAVDAEWERLQERIA